MLDRRWEETEDRLQRLELALDRFNMNTGRSPVFRGSTYEVSDYHIAQWTPGSSLPLTDSSKYARFYKGNLEIRGGALDISTAAGGARMEMTGDYLKTWDASENQTFYLDFTTGNLLMSGVFYVPDKFKLDTYGIRLQTSAAWGGGIWWVDDIDGSGSDLVAHLSLIHNYAPAIELLTLSAESYYATNSSSVLVTANGGTGGRSYSFYLSSYEDKMYLLGNSKYFLYGTASELVVNEGSDDLDLRVESDNNKNMLFVDGGEDRVGIGTGTPSATLDVVGDTEITGQTHQKNTNCGTLVSVADTVVQDNVVTSVLRITTTNETGNTDGGHYSVLLRITVGEGDYNTAAGAVKTWLGTFNRVVRYDGAGTTSAVTAIYDGTVNAINPSSKNIVSLAVTTTEVSEYVVDVQVQCDVSGSTQTDPHIFVHAELDWVEFRTPPTLTAL